MKPAPPLDTKTEVAPSRAVPAGRIQLEPVGIPVDTKETVVWVSRQGWPDLGPSTPVIRIEQYFSFDGGVTWPLYGGASVHVGGTWTHWTGKVMPACPLGLSGLPQEKNPNRQIRIEVIPLVPLTTKVDLECRSKATAQDVRDINGRAG